MTSSLLILAVAATIATVSYAEHPPAEVGKTAPAFSGTDVDGKTVALSDFKGKVIVLEWTNPGCPFVQRVYSEMIIPGLQKAYVPKGVVWLVINSTKKDHPDFRTSESLKKTYKEWNAAYTTMLLDAEGTTGKLYDARTTPHMFIIDSKGTLVYNGALDDDPRGANEKRVNYVKAALDEALAGKAVTTSSTKPYGCSVKY